MYANRYRSSVTLLYPNLLNNYIIKLINLSFLQFYVTACSGKLSSSPNSQAPPPGTGNLPHIIDGTTPMPYTGSSSQVVGAATPPWRIVLAVAVLGLVTAALGLVAQFIVLFKLCWRNQAAAAAAGAGG